MSDIEITLKLPSELVERAREAGVAIDDLTEPIIERIESEIRRCEAARKLTEVADQLNGSMTMEEIGAELAAAKAERIAAQQTNKP